MTFGQSSGKGTKINYTDAADAANSAMFFVLSGEKYTVAAEVEYRDQNSEDAVPWMRMRWAQFGRCDELATCYFSSFFSSPISFST